ncbi:MAG: glycosyltransferase family A protein [Thermofilaceae archaeon]|uniref:Glycosyltransferase 2-like domain-containing protein n=1 Tax=Saccharolobus shibatae (strain ATCC 51178 / DSM 5389 / JCM 8931 / NBRC 15437 / B12) TaxID=523848 RepID=A0A8F5GTC3_SACSH|nr:glycosyltransferase family A protein [Saccharolobus shibatae]MCH4816733.1 glycosyltransferase family 2 protein [Saccharolobus shibatae]QXJ28651.1 hypothetical protein J5U23_01520 [Saccharolobus shibatae B12]
MVLLSITITAKNEAPVIDKVLNNLVEQLNDLNYEMILIDNWSTDNTFQLLKKYENEYIKVFRYKGSKGSARNFALKNADGKYVMALDADQIYLNLDKFLKDYFSTYSSYAVKIGRSSFPIISPKELLMNVGGWRDLQFGEDWDLWFRLAEACKYVYLADYDWVFGEHIRDHKNNYSSIISRIRKYMIKYRDLYIVGLPVYSQNIYDKFFYRLGRVLSFFNSEKKIVYNCTKYLEMPIDKMGSEIDWDLQFHYNLIKYQLLTCKNKTIFLEILSKIDNYLKRNYGIM